MKRLTLSILVPTFMTLSLFAQNPHSKNVILGLKGHTYKTSDIGIENAKNLLEIEEKEYTISFSNRELELTTTDKYKTEKGKITFHHYIGKYYDSDYNFLYSKNYKTLQKQVYIKEKGNEEEVVFKFDKKNRLIEQKTIFKNNNPKKYREYNDSNNTMTQYELKGDGTKYRIINYKINSKGNIIERNAKATTFKLHDVIHQYTYNANSQVVEVSMKKMLDGVVKKDSEASSIYTYNKEGLIVEDNGNLSEGDFNLSHHFIYEYKYDKYGNWIAKYKFSTNYGYVDYKDKNYKGVTSIILRKLTYKKGIITGQTGLKETTIQNYLNTVYKNNPFITKTAPKKGVYWTRTNDRAVKVYNNGKYIAKQSNLLIILGDDFYVNDSINNKMYVLKEFKLKPQNKAYYKATAFASNDEVVWYRSKEKSITSYKNGKNLAKKLNFHKIYGNHFYINDSTTNTFYKLNDFKLKGIKDAFYKVIKIGVYNDVLWIKLESGNYTIVQNGKNITKQVKMVYAKNKNDVLIKINDTPKYVMLNGKNVSPNDFYKAVSYNQYIISNPNETKIEVIPNGFLWKKNKAEHFYIYKDNKIDPSKIKVIGFYQHQLVYDIDDDFSYLLEDFNNKGIEQYHTIKMLNGNSFFYKTNDNKIGIFINGKTAGFHGSKYAENGIDVISKGENSNITYILKNYKNVNNLILGEVIIEKK